MKTNRQKTNKRLWSTARIAKEIRPKRKYLAATCLLIIVCLFASLIAYSRPGQDRKTCFDSCKKDHDACLAQTPETDPEKEAQRNQACHDRFKECAEKCGN